jgi:flavodoxin
LSSLRFVEAQQPPSGTQPPTADQRILIVYLSRTNNTNAIAEFIHGQIGGTLVALELARPYPTDYNGTVQQVARENETGYLPPLKTKIDRIEQYDVVFLGFPTWGMQLPSPVKSFLREYNLKGTTVIPFNTNAGYGVGSSFQMVKELCPHSTVLEGYTTRGRVERAESIWLSREREPGCTKGSPELVCTILRGGQGEVDAQTDRRRKMIA